MLLKIMFLPGLFDARRCCGGFKKGQELCDCYVLFSLTLVAAKLLGSIMMGKLEFGMHVACCQSRWLVWVL